MKRIWSGVTMIILVAVLSLSGRALASTTAHWGFEARGGIVGPTGKVLKSFVGGCCSWNANLSAGYLLGEKYSIAVGVGASRWTGSLIGATSGTQSGERFSLLLLPMQLESTFRFQFSGRQLLIPYGRGGFDLAYFRENDGGTLIKGTKFGMHGGGGLLIALNRFVDKGMDWEYGVNDMFFVLDGRYQWLSGFGGSGLNLSGWALTGGIRLHY